MGSSHLRVLTFVPVSHFALQGPHDDQRPQWPSTGAVEIHYDALIHINYAIKLSWCFIWGLVWVAQVWSV